MTLSKKAHAAMRAADEMLFAQRVVRRADDGKISVVLALQEELDLLVRNHGVIQPFARIPPMEADTCLWEIQTHDTVRARKRMTYEEIKAILKLWIFVSFRRDSFREPELVGMDEAALDIASMLSERPCPSCGSVESSPEYSLKQQAWLTQLRERRAKGHER